MNIQRIVVSILVVLTLIQSTTLAFAAPLGASATAATSTAADDHVDHAACTLEHPAVEHSHASSSLASQDVGTRVATCYNCSGSGNCWTCQGSGKASGASCYMCNGSGKCYYCAGSGSK